MTSKTEGNTTTMTSDVQHQQMTSASDRPEKGLAFWDPRSVRFQLTIILMIATMSNTLVRNTLSMAMVCMVNTTALLHELDESIILNSTGQGSVKCKISKTDILEYDGPLMWGSQDQGFLFSAMYWGGVISGVPAGYLADRYNPKIIITLCLLLNVAGCFLTPITALKGGLIPVFVLRVIMGLGGQATMFPSISAITARWIPPTERSTVIAIYTAGSQVAAIIGSPLNAFLCKTKHFMGGWPAIFYVTGFISSPIVILWWITISNTPDESRFLLERERKLIQRTLQKQNVHKKKITFKEVPWRKLLTSTAVMVAVINNFTLSVMNSTYSSYIPIYFKESLKMDLASNGFMSSLPFISQWLGKIVFSTISDQMKARTKFSHTWICRIFNSIGTFFVAAFLVAAAYMNCTQAGLAVAFVTIANGLFSCQVPGFLTSLVCVAPLYAGIVTALSRFCGQIGAVVAPYVVGAITVQGTSNQWREVFIIIAGTMVVTGFLFLIFGSADIQEWAKAKPSDTSKVASITDPNPVTLPDLVNSGVGLPREHQKVQNEIVISNENFICKF